MPEPLHSLLPQDFRCAQMAAEKNQPKVCSFSWRGTVCRIRAYLDMAEMGFLNKGLGEVSPCSAATAPTTEGFQIRCLPACGSKTVQTLCPELQTSILGAGGNRMRPF